MKSLETRDKIFFLISVEMFWAVLLRRSSAATSLTHQYVM
jgi:hypothetical protein